MRTGSDVAYFDASALHKLVVGEPESRGAPAGRAGMAPASQRARLAVVELIRSVRRADPALEPAARRLLGRVSLLADDQPGASSAQRNSSPQALRALDAIHVTTALRVRSALAAFVSYDRRQLEAAEALGLPVASPR